MKNHKELREKIMREALEVVNKRLNENKNDEERLRRPKSDPHTYEEIYPTLTEREKELNDMFVDKFGKDTKRIKINLDCDNFDGTEAECYSFRIKDGIVWFRTLYNDDVHIGELCDVDEEYDAIFHNDPVENYNIIKSWCEQSNDKEDLSVLEAKLARKYALTGTSPEGKKYPKWIYFNDNIYIESGSKARIISYDDGEYDSLDLDDDHMMKAFYSENGKIYITNTLSDDLLSNYDAPVVKLVLDYISDENNLDFDE